MMLQVTNKMLIVEWIFNFSLVTTIPLKALCSLRDDISNIMKHILELYNSSKFNL